MAASQDPFYLIRGDIQQQYNDIQKSLSKWHTLTGNNPERKSLTDKITHECDSIKWQLSQLSEAIERAAANPARFNLTVEEIQSRRKWLDTTQRQVDGIKESLRTATSAAPHIPTQADKVASANDGFLHGESQKQATIMKEQDHVLDEIAERVKIVGTMGVMINDHLKEDEVLLGQLEEGMDTTGNRLKATTKKMVDVIRRSSNTTQVSLLAFLIVVLIVVSIFALKP